MTLTPAELAALHAQRLAAWQARQARNFRRKNYHRRLTARYIPGRQRWR